MLCALREAASIDTTMSTRRLPRPSATTGHVFHRIGSHLVERSVSAYRAASAVRHPTETGGSAPHLFVETPRENSAASGIDRMVVRPIPGFTPDVGVDAAWARMQHDRSTVTS